MSELKERGFDDPAFLEFSNFKLLAKLQEMGWKPLKYFDTLIASGITWGAYLKYMNERGLEIDLNNPNPNAIKYAQLVLRRTQASSFFKDLPAFIGQGGSLPKLLFQFQTFILNRWSYIRHDLYDLGLKNKDLKRAGGIVFWLMLATLAETGIRMTSKEITNLLSGGGDDEDKESWAKIGNKYMWEILGTAPFISQAKSFWDYGSVPVPVLQTINDTLDVVGNLKNAKRPLTKLKRLNDLAKVAGQMVGVPGTAQVTEIIRAFLKKQE
jgi:hypothetical protein